MNYKGLPFFAQESSKATTRLGEPAYSSETVPPEPITFFVPLTRPQVAPPSTTFERVRPEMSIQTTTRGPAHKPTTPPGTIMKFKPYPRLGHIGYFDKRIAGHAAISEPSRPTLEYDENHRVRFREPARRHDDE